MKIKLTGNVKGLEKEMIFAETYLDHIDMDFASRTLRNVSECFLYEIVRYAEKEILRRETLKRLNDNLANIMKEARENGCDLINIETGEIVDATINFC